MCLIQRKWEKYERRKIFCYPHGCVIAALLLMNPTSLPRMSG